MYPKDIVWQKKQKTKNKRKKQKPTIGKYVCNLYKGQNISTRIMQTIPRSKKEEKT